MKLSPLRFFLVVARPGADVVMLALAMVAFAAYVAVVDPAGFDQVFGYTILVQFFAASTGYRDRLRRGHFDPILTGGTSRWRIAAAHWTVSAGLGLAVWIALAAMEVVFRPSQFPTSLTPPAVAAFLYVSTAVWTISLSFPRYSGGLLWLATLIALMATQHLQTLRVTFTPAPDTWVEALRSAGSAFVLPFLMMLNPTVAGFRLLTLIIAGTAIVWTLGAATIGRFDGALVEDS